MISIIIPTCKAENLIPCLESIEKYTKDAEVIVVANGYDQDHIDGDVEVLWFDEKIGYPAAVNAGIKSATGDFIVLLNDDTVLLEQQPNQWLNMLSAPFSDPEVAITGPWMMYNSEINRGFICFFCCMIRKSVLDEIGLLDETFGAGYAEDVDWCCRVQDTGYKCIQVPADQVSYDGNFGYGNFPIYHLGNQTFRNWPGGQELLAKNHAILRERYGGVYIENAKKLGEWVTDDELRWLARQAQKSKVVIELGSWFGKSSTAIADNLPPDGVVYCVDTWAGSEAEKDTNHAQAREMDGDFAYNEFLHNLWRHVQTGKLRPIRMHGKHAATLLKEMGVKADFIFIDAGHLQHEVEEDCWSYLPLLKPGGVISGHDYGRPQWPYVTNAVVNVFGGNHACNPNTTIWSTDCNPMPKIYDCFPFFNELELLEIRLNELYDTVDHFVLVEATHTHQGRPKPLHFVENRDRFAKFMDKIIYVSDSFEGVQDDVWARERHQRSMIMEGLKDAKDNDIIIITDADEIPSAAAVKSYRPEMGIACFNMVLYYYYLNSEGIDSVWAEAKITTLKNVKELTPEGIRYIYNIRGKHGDTAIPNGGWHYSFCGGAARVKEKIQAFGHAEYNRPDVLDNVEARMEAGKDVFDREMYYRIVDKCGTSFVQENWERFRELGFVK